MKNVEIRKEANPGHNLKIEVDGQWYKRFPVYTGKINIKEDISPAFEKIKEEYQEGDWIAVSEKFITITEGRLIHKSLLKPKWLARSIAKIIRWNMGRKAYENDPAYAVPEKVQAAIFIAGWWRIFFAALLGIPLSLIYKLFGQKKGWFYILAGNRISEIDGTFSEEIPPYNEFAKIYPENPKKTCSEIESKYGLPCCIIDSNNINTEIIGMSLSMPLSHERARNILIDNPMGQGRELTPIILVRAEKNKKEDIN